MKIIIHNSKFEDNITFYADSIEEAREIALKECDKRGWKKEDYWSEVITYHNAKDTKVSGCSIVDIVNGDKQEVIGNIYENLELLKDGE